MCSTLAYIMKVLKCTLAESKSIASSLAGIFIALLLRFDKRSVYIIMVFSLIFVLQ